MDPTPSSDCSPTFVEEGRRGDQAVVPEGSLTRAQCEIATVLNSENAFVYGGVVVEDPENLPSSSGNNYEWASRDGSEFSSAFNSKPVLLDWGNDSCILRTLGYGSCIKLIACGENERVFHGRKNSKNDFFYIYSYLFYDMYLHPNSWGYIQVFAIMCQALAIRPTVALFLYIFRTRPIAKRVVGFPEYRTRGHDFDATHPIL